MIVTVITMYRGRDAESFVWVVRGPLTSEQHDTWRKRFKCDSYYKGNPCDVNNMFFRQMDMGHSQKPPQAMKNVDGENDEN